MGSLVVIEIHWNLYNLCVVPMAIKSNFKNFIFIYILFLRYWFKMKQITNSNLFIWIYMNIKFSKFGFMVIGTTQRLYKFQGISITTRDPVNFIYITYLCGGSIKYVEYEKGTIFWFIKTDIIWMEYNTLNRIFMTILITYKIYRSIGSVLVDEFVP